MAFEPNKENLKDGKNNTCIPLTPGRSLVGGFNPQNMLNHALSVAKTSLSFGLVNRATYHSDGTVESDSTHTVMLAMLVADLAKIEGLDVGLAVQYAIVHDLPETYAGDTCTARELSIEEKKAKEMRESKSLEKIEKELGNCWTTSMIAKYEKQDEPEARLVRYVDKILPKLTHIINEGLSYKKLKMSVSEVEQNHTKQGKKLQVMYPNFHATRMLFDEACEMALSRYCGKEKNE